MSLGKLKALGFNAASITYDSQEILCNFGNAYKIEYPLLSDSGSKVIRAFGILNTNVPEDHKMMYGMPWPGDFVLAPDHSVVDKLFLRNYEHRPSASTVVMRNAGAESATNSAVITTDVLSATVALSTDRCFPGQEIATSVSIRITPGWHLYGQPLPDHYRATQIAFSGPLVGDQSLELPPARPLLLEALGETLPVYAGEIRAVGKLGIKWSPPGPAKFLEAIGARIEPGDYKIPGELRFQACSDTVCEPPQAIKFELPLHIEAGVPPAPKDAKAKT
jgi:hypothetical protein